MRRTESKDNFEEKINLHEIVQEISMLKKLVNKAKAAIPAATKAVKKAVTAAKDKITKAVNTNAGKIKENIANTVKKAVEAIPSCVKQIGKTAKKVQAAIPSCVNAAKQKTKESADKAKTSISNTRKTATHEIGNSIQTISENVNQAYTSINNTIQNEIDCSGEKGQRILTGIWEEYQKTYVEIVKEEVYTKPFVYQHPYTQLSQGLHFLLESRKIIVEEYPIFSWMNRVSENAHQKAREKFLKSADQFGNKVYNQDIPIVSSFTGGLFHASAMNNDKGKSNTASVTGSFLNGFLGIGILGTVDGLVGAVADSFTALEGINQFFYEPEKSVPVFRSYVISELNKKFIHGSAEEKSRVAGAITFEVVTAVLGELAAAKAGDQAGDAGKTAKILDQVEDMDDAVDASKIAEQIVQIDKAEDVLDSASDMEKAEDILDQAADAEKAGRVADTAKSFQTSVEEYVKKLLSSDKVGEAAEKADDIVNAVRRRLNSSGSELEPALATGQLDNVDDFDLFSRKYNEYIKEKPNVDTGGVKINKIEGEVGSGADLVDDAENLIKGSTKKYIPSTGKWVPIGKKERNG